MDLNSRHKYIYDNLYVSIMSLATQRMRGTVHKANPKTDNSARANQIQSKAALPWSEDNSLNSLNMPLMHSMSEMKQTHVQNKGQQNIDHNPLSIVVDVQKKPMDSSVEERQLSVVQLSNIIAQNNQTTTGTKESYASYERLSHERPSDIGSSTRPNVDSSIMQSIVDIKSEIESHSRLLNAHSTALKNHKDTIMGQTSHVKRQTEFANEQKRLNSEMEKVLENHTMHIKRGVDFSKEQEQINSSVQDTLHDHTGNMGKLGTNLTKYGSFLKDCNAAMTRLKDEISVLRNENAVLPDDDRRVRADILESLQAELKSIKSRLNSANIEAERMKLSHEHMKRDIGNVSKEQEARLKSVHENVRTDMDTMSLRLQKQAGMLQDCHGSMKKLAHSVSSSNNAISEIKEKFMIRTSSQNKSNDVPNSYLPLQTMEKKLRSRITAS